MSFSIVARTVLSANETTNANTKLAYFTLCIHATSTSYIVLFVNAEQCCHIVLLSLWLILKHNVLLNCGTNDDSNNNYFMSFVSGKCRKSFNTL